MAQNEAARRVNFSTFAHLGDDKIVMDEPHAHEFIVRVAKNDDGSYLLHRWSFRGDPSCRPDSSTDQIASLEKIQEWMEGLP